MKKIFSFLTICFSFAQMSFCQTTVQAFNYLNDRKEKLIAKLEPTYTTFGDAFTHDPEFLIFDETGKQIGHSEWLTYLGTDGHVWITKVHAEYQHGPKNIRIWFESKNPNGDGNNPSFGIVDWSYHKQNMQILSTVSKGEAPNFAMTDVGILIIAPPEKKEHVTIDWKGGESKKD